MMPLRSVWNRLYRYGGCAEGGEYRVCAANTSSLPVPGGVVVGLTRIGEMIEATSSSTGAPEAGSRRSSIEDSLAIAGRGVTIVSLLVAASASVRTVVSADTVIWGTTVIRCPTVNGPAVSWNTAAAK